MSKSIWAYLVLGVLIAGLGLLVFGWSGQMAGHDSTPPDTTAVVEGGPLADVILPETFSETAQIGKTAFEAVCAACHGINAAGQNGIAPPLVHRIYEPSHHGDGAFWLATQNGVRAHHWRFGDMPPVDGLTRADVGNIVAYIRELQRANGIN